MGHYSRTRQPKCVEACHCDALDVHAAVIQQKHTVSFPSHYRIFVYRPLPLANRHCRTYQGEHAQHCLNDWLDMTLTVGSLKDVIVLLCNLLAFDSSCLGLVQEICQYVGELNHSVLTSHPLSRLEQLIQSSQDILQRKA